MKIGFKKVISYTTIPIIMSLTSHLSYADSTSELRYRAKMGDALNHVAKRAKSMSGPEMGTMGKDNKIILADVSSDNFVTLDLVAKNSSDELIDMLTKLGARNMSSFGRMVSAQVPADKLFDMAESDTLAFVQPMLRATNAGLVQQQGDRSMGTDTTRTELGLDGTGFTVGVLSDSFECDPGSLAGAAYTTPEEDVINGEIPATYQNLSSFDNVDICLDEGRAIAQLVFDILPGADIIFHSAFNGQADFAEGIIELAEAGADVIVDDIIYFAEPMFQDGIIAQAADRVAELGIPYYSSAMNFARISYASDYRSVTTTIDGIEGTWHDWDPSEGQDTLKQVFLDGSLETTLSFQWDSPNFSVSGGAGTENDIDLIAFDSNNNKLLNCFDNLDAEGNFPPLCQFSSTMTDDAGTNLGGDAIELVTIYDELGGSEVQLGILTRHGEAPGQVKYVAFRGIFLQTEYPLDAPTSFGHSAAVGAESVGAAAFYFTEEFIDDPFTLMLRRLAGEPDCIPACLNVFSSAGGVPILFDIQGNRLAHPEIRLKPGITAPDAANTTFFFDEAPEDDDDRDGDFIF